MLFCVSTPPPPPPFRGEEQADSVLRLSEAPAATQELGTRVRKTAADVVAKPQSAASTDAAHRVREASASLGGAAEACVELAARCALYLGCIKAELLRVEEYSHPDGCNGSAHNASVHEEPFRSLRPGDLYFRTQLCARTATRSAEHPICYSFVLAPLPPHRKVCDGLRLGRVPAGRRHDELPRARRQDRR